MPTYTRLLDDADTVLRSEGSGPWTRTTAFLLRQALEACVCDFWRHTQPGVERCRVRTQVLCLAEYADEATARRASGAWAALSAACHYHGYGFNPTVGELRTLHDEVRVLAERLSPVPRSS
ncbi:hypothetical protein SAMN05216275_11975 [Streptosporangium canum]|uniref:Uncharacterized protein n=1 Tax=Streptosporangium canum TaxID=324952 RepID=A0A1I3XKH5_9ACTN|nr:hypothetical protein [Streptosporangium canum]SFK19541.1 hypothetical protein SAMN05216275_11975 [Streptosporangium canum]